MLISTFCSAACRLFLKGFSVSSMFIDERGCRGFWGGGGKERGVSQMRRPMSVFVKIDRANQLVRTNSRRLRRRLPQRKRNFYLVNFHGKRNRMWELGMWDGIPSLDVEAKMSPFTIDHFCLYIIFCWLYCVFSYQTYFLVDQTSRPSHR